MLVLKKRVTASRGGGQPTCDHNLDWKEAMIIKKHQKARLEPADTLL